MAKDKELLELTGKVEEVLPNSTFRVRVENITNPVLCYIGGKLKQHKIKIILGDAVKIEMSPYDLNKGRITYRL
jgi:translation initiation factor IF-1